MTEPQLTNLRGSAILILQAMQATILPLQMRAARIEGKEGPSPLRNQDNIPLNFELYMTGNILFNAVFGILKTCVENGDEMAMKALQVFSYDNRGDMMVMSNGIKIAAEKALSILSPGDPLTKEFGKGERP